MENSKTTNEIDDCGSCIPSLDEQFEAHLKFLMVNSPSLKDSSILCDEFKPLNSYQICPIHRHKTVDQIQFLIKRISKSNFYSLDTERSRSSGFVTLIKIELREIQHLENIVLVLEVSHLPASGTFLFDEKKQLINKIFLPEKQIFIWNILNKVDLYTLIERQYLPRSTFDKLNFIGMEERCKIWYGRRYVLPEFHQHSISLSEDFERTWSIDIAITRIFNESIEKFSKTSTSPKDQMKQSALYCLALTKLSIVIELDWTLAQLRQFKSFHQKTE